jgi:uncharacterized Zn finger protein
MCKHVAAVLYAIGARLDQQPELLFKLHKVDQKELIAKAGQGLPLGGKVLAPDKTLGSEDLAAIFGLDMAQTADAAAPAPVPAAKLRSATKRVAKKTKIKVRARKGKKKRRMIAKPAPTAIPAVPAVQPGGSPPSDAR